MTNFRIGHFLKYVIQLIGTLLIMVFVPSTILVTIMLAVWWYFTFSPLSKIDIIIFVLACVAYTISDVIVLQQGIFEFRDKDIFGMPYYELFMWGFYFLNTSRLLSGNPTHKPLPGLIFALTIVAILGSFQSVTFALFATGIILCLALLFFRTKWDFVYTTYVLVLGLIVEFTGTYFGIWSYHIDQYLFWWIITWAISGLVLYRALLPASLVIKDKL